MKALLWVLSGLLALFCAPVFAEEKRVAVFDYDDRLHIESTVAKHIEKNLRSFDQSLVIQHYSGQADMHASLSVLKNLEQQGFDLIIVITSDALIIAQHILKKTPVLFTNVNNPRFLGVQDLKRPGRNFSGASYYVPVDKQLEFFKRIHPTMKKVGFIFDEKNKSKLIELKETRYVCKRKVGLEFVSEMIHSAAALPEATKRLLAQDVDAVVITTSGVIYNNIERIKPLTDREKIPIFSYHKNAVPDGAVASLSSDYYVMVEKLIIPMAKKILYENMHPGTMPVGFLEDTIISLNATAASAIGLNIPKDIIEKADFVY